MWGFIGQQLQEECDLSQDTKCTRTEDMARDMDPTYDRLLSVNDVINLIFKMAPRLIKRVYILLVILQFKQTSISLLLPEWDAGPL